VVGTFGRPTARAERARHVDAALEYRPSSNVRLHVALYDRQERDMLRLEGSETRMVDGRLVFASSLAPSWQNALSGSARGVELIVQRRDPARFSGWVGYSYGRSRYADAVTGESFWADFDQRHTFAGYGRFRLSSQTSLGAKLRLGTNFPLAGYFEERSGGLFAGSDRNTVRLPEYARLDLRADRAFNYTRRRLTLFAEVINVLDRTNKAQANGVVMATGRAVDFTDAMFPLLPSAGIRIDF
jgi:TonB dependent receptor